MSTHTHNEATSDWSAVIHKFGRDKVLPRSSELDAHPQDMELIRSLLLEVGRIGLYGTVISPEYGGTGPSSLALHEAVDAFAYHNAGLAMSTMPTYLTARALMSFGTDEQKSRWLPKIAAGEVITSWAVTEPDTGSDVANITTKAVRDGDGWQISGTKMFITNASIADAVLLLCRTGGPGVKETLTTFVIPMDAPGISVTGVLEKMGLRSSPTCELVFDNVRVEDTDRLGEVGEGWEVAMDVLDYERLAIPAMTAGMAQRALELSSAYAGQRTAFGGPIADLAPVGEMLADMGAALLECRLLYRHAAALSDAGRPSIAEGSIGKLVAGRLANEVTSNAVQIHGGYGYCREYEVERLYRDARLFMIGGGTTQVQRKIVAQQLRRSPKWGASAGMWA